MNKVEFKLFIPNWCNWHGRWPSKNEDYLIFKTLTDKKLSFLGLDTKPDNSWSYRWNDGWTAEVSARIMKKGEKKRKSDGFCGYDWMADSILLHNIIKTRKEK